MENRKRKTQKLVIDGNALYELDIECLERKPKGIPLQSTRNTPIIEQAKNNQKKESLQQQASVYRKTSCLLKNRVAGAKPPTGTRGGSPSNIAPSHGEGVWG